MFKAFRQLLILNDDDPELISAQYRAFVRQMPLLYFVLCVNALAISYTFVKFGHLLLTAVTPVALTALCATRAVVWWRRRNQKVAHDVALQSIRTTVRLAALIAAAFTGWGFLLFSYGDDAARVQIALFLGLTMIACVFCLTQVRPAALIVAAIGILPFTVFFTFVSDGQFRAIAVNMALVSVGVVTFAQRNYRDFVELVASQRALMATHSESLRLSDDNLRLANQDALTGLANRRAFVDCAERLTAGTAGEVAVAFADLDGFKRVNDDYGHETGDALIGAVARALEAVLPDGALLARLGGDEFAAILAGEDALGQLRAFADAACDRFLQPFDLGHRVVTVGSSFGVAAGAPGEVDSNELIRRADAAMYHVKLNGKLGVQCYAPELEAARRGRQRLRDEIAQGLVRGEFEMFYQPIVDAHTREISSMEALLRWPRRSGGALGPDKFIPIAEAEGLIEALGLFALRRACADLQAFGDLALSVNVSPAQLRDPFFPRKVAETLAATGFPASRLSLEITEGHLIDDPERAAAAISGLKGMGVRVVLDDFGTGYTSIAYLQKYRFDAIKIDRSLASRIEEDAQARVLVTGVIYLANGLNMSVTAEGVETEEQATLLRLAGCTNLQGYRFHMPKPLAHWVALAERRLSA
jgi:diguanylate cyclase (GGDEF)-like protein